MLLFNRMLRVTGGAAAAAWAAEVTAGVNKHSVSEVSLWRAAFGAPVGTIAWSAPVEALGQVDDLNAATAADADLTALMGKGAEYVAEAEPDPTATTADPVDPAARPVFDVGRAKS